MIKYLTGGPAVWSSKSVVGFGVRCADLKETRAKKVVDQFGWSHVFPKIQILETINSKCPVNKLHIEVEIA